LNAVLVFSIDSRPPQGALSYYAVHFVHGNDEERESQSLKLFNLTVL